MDDRLTRILALVRSHVPRLELVDKRRLRWMRMLGKVVRPLVPDFEHGYTTVLGRRVLLPRPPEAMNPDVLASTLAHELVHQLDQRRWGPLFYLSYGLALPVGRTLRAYWERRAYAVDLLLARERGGSEEVARVEALLVELFSGPGYFWMWSGRRAARRFLAPTVEAVLDGSLDEVEPYRSVLRAWRGVSRPELGAAK